MSTCNLTTAIKGTDCIGDSRTIINNNFTELEKIVCALSASTISTTSSSSITLTFSPITRTLEAFVAPSSITTTELGADSVEGVNIKNGAITNEKLSFDGGAITERNKIINGSFNVWQRGTIFENSNGFTADRFVASCAGSNITPNHVGGVQNLLVQRSTEVPENKGFTHSITLQREPGTFGFQDISLLYYFEQSDTAQLCGNTVTLSFYTKAGSTFNVDYVLPEIYVSDNSQQGIASMHRSNANLTPLWDNFTVLQGNAVTPGEVWVRHVCTFNIPDNTKDLGLGIRYTPPLGVASMDETLYVTGIQLEIGSVATPFEHKPISVEVSMCKRYFEKSYDINTQPGTNTSNGSVYNSENITTDYKIYNTQTIFTVNKANTPIVQLYNPNSINDIGSILCNSVGIPISNILANETRISYIQTATSILGNSLFQWHYTADAEMY